MYDTTTNAADANDLQATLGYEQANYYGISYGTYEFPNLGHGVMDSDRCALEIGLQFLDDPTTEPDVSCMDDLSGPDFK